MATKPKKPYADFPLYAHNGGVWAKKIRGKVHYFGPWSDPQGALETFLAQRDYLMAGRTPPPEKLTVANLLDEFLGEKLSHLETEDITQTTFDEYESICVIIDAYFGKHRPADSLAKDDFDGLRKHLAKGKRKATLSPVTLKRRLTIARMIFAEQSRANLKALKSPPLRTLRAARRKKGELLYSASDIRKLVKASEAELKAMILLGINCGFGPKDCFTLPASAVSRGWHNYPRPKTEVERRCPLWPETTAAIKVVGLPLNGRVWDRFVVDREFKKVCKQANVECQGFYTLRRTFETIATTGGRTTGNLEGGGIRLLGAGALALTGSTVSGNSSGDDRGGIYSNSGAVTLSGSTVSGNTSSSRGGGIYLNSGAVTLTSSTVTGNRSRVGGGVNVFDTGSDPLLTIQNSIIAGNTASDAAPDLGPDPDSTLDIDFSLNRLQPDRRHDRLGRHRRHRNRQRAERRPAAWPAC